MDDTALLKIVRKMDHFHSMNGFEHSYLGCYTDILLFPHCAVIAIRNLIHQKNILLLARRREEKALIQMTTLSLISVPRKLVWHVWQHETNLGFGHMEGGNTFGGKNSKIAS